MSDSKFTVKELRGVPIIAGAGFNGAIMRGATLEAVETVASSFADVDFSGAHLLRCNLKGTFEGSLFRDATLDDISFLDSNVAFADFTGANLSRVAFDFSAFPHLFGIDLEQLDQGVAVFADAERAENDASARIEAATLRAIAPQLIAEYTARQDYFAAANMASICGETKDLMPLFLDGIRAAWLARNLREIKHLCKLVRHVEDRQGLFGVSALHSLYDRITALVARSGETSLQNHYALHDGQIRAYLLAGKPGTVQLHFQSRTMLPTEANQVTAQVIDALQSIGRAVGLPLEITGAHFSFNSYPRHVIEVRIIQQPAPASKGPSPWLTFLVATVSMMFTGLNAVRPLFDHQQVSPATQQIILKQHQQIGPMIVPLTTIITKDGLPLTGWEGGIMIPLTPSEAAFPGR